MTLDTPLRYVSGIGPKMAELLKTIDLSTVSDLIYYLPFRYDDFSTQETVSALVPGSKATVKGAIWSINDVRTKSGKLLTTAILHDGTSPITLTWFNQKWLSKSLSVGDNIQVSGRIEKLGNKLSIIQPVWEKISPDLAKSTIHTGRLVPIYPENSYIHSRFIRSKIDQVLPQIESEIIDPLPNDIRGQMPTLSAAIREVHFPTDWNNLQQARNRLAFDELFFISLSTIKVRFDWQNTLTFDSIVDDTTVDEYIQKLPFKLTAAQLRVAEEILNDLRKPTPMNRLVQGEVGSGKTVVASVAIYALAKAGFRTLLMAPTEVLAFQHHKTLTNLLAPFDIRVGIYTGSKKTTELVKKTTDAPMVIVGTHALVAKNFGTERVGLVIIDEQQRFGVRQRGILRSNAQIPHFLTMTATPIPRTIALTLYGDLDLSIIDEMPPGRQIVQTNFIPSKKRADCYKFIESRVKAGEQVYVITPLIEFSESLATTKAAKVEFEKLSTEVFPDLRLGLLHGALKSKEKEQILNDFKDHKIDILISTTVVEVGVDVANATIMVIEGADRFGLSALHQLRGRVGRSSLKSYCFLFSDNESPQVVNRLKNLEKISNGLKLAELDLSIRGSGQVFGTEQSGQISLKIADLSDLGLLESARSWAQKLLESDPSLDNYPLIKAKYLQFTSGIVPD